MQTRIHRGDPARWEHLPEGWTIHYDATVNGRQLTPGTEVSIRGERGRFRFLRRVTMASGRECLDFWGGPTGCCQWRSFYPERVRTVHRIPKTDKNNLEAHRAGKAATA
jgi:hypothetical protein